MRINTANVIYYPAYKLIAGGYPIVLVILPLNARSQSPLSPTDGRAMQRLNRSELQRLLSADQAS